MGARGPRSQSALTLVTPMAVRSYQRAKPPVDLSDAEAMEWRRIVDSLPADWFSDETLPLLAQYCRHIISSRRVAAMVANLDRAVTAEIEGGETSEAAAVLGSVKALDRLFKMQERESRCLASLATKMRISQQSTYDKSKTKGDRTPARRPWED